MLERSVYKGLQINDVINKWSFTNFLFIWKCLWLYTLKDCYMRKRIKFITKHSIKWILTIKSSTGKYNFCLHRQLDWNVCFLSVLQRGTDDQSCIMSHKDPINSDELKYSHALLLQVSMVYIKWEYRQPE